MTFSDFANLSVGLYIDGDSFNNVELVLLNLLCNLKFSTLLFNSVLCPAPSFSVIDISNYEPQSASWTKVTCNLPPERLRV